MNLQPYTDSNPDFANSPNPVVQTCSYHGATIRVYKNGMIDAINGTGFELSPGFESMQELCQWIVDMELAIIRNQKREAVAEAFGKKAYDLEGGR